MPESPSYPRKSYLISRKRKEMKICIEYTFQPGREIREANKIGYPSIVATYNSIIEYIL
jgi:hypothetical protein